ncbi:hypothetical protein [Ideonella oryzae]|uniref:Uncharacterized protein n=1 Tax=Ideonella oryzae TaxID=2937441 RepID=A0ABT1BQR0_9BURK|nr:hypothetical protein [Ideonella oryzae]MCO5978572.1 hypothetical protein [Ideonella oryzae]
MRCRVLHLLPALALICALGSAQAATWPSVSLPPRSQGAPVGEELRVNGLPTRIQRFQSQLSVPELLAYYQRLWGAGQPARARPVNQGDWQGVASLQPPFQLVLQARPGAQGGSEGLLSVANLGDLQRDYIPRGFPQFADTRIVQVTDSQDSGQHSVLVQQSSRAGFALNVDRWRREWQRQGFQLTQEAQVPAGTGQGRGWTAFFDRQGAAVEVSVAEMTPGGDVAVTVHQLSRSRP